MRCFSLVAAVALVFVAPNAKVFAAQQQLPIPITQCGVITRSGNYVLENDLVLQVSEQGFGTESCLTVSASRVNVNLGGNTITVACTDPYQCQSEFGVPGGIGIEVAANNVSISNGSVEDYVYGIVAYQANYMSVSNLALTAVVGVTLSNVSQSTVRGVTYQGADEQYHGMNGPLLYVSGGSNNSFSNLSGDTGTDIGIVDAVQIVGSNSNSISQLNLENVSSCSNAVILLTGGSSFNLVTGNTLFDLCGSGIEADTGGRRNIITANNVTTISPPTVFAMLDENPKCGSDFWFMNTFSNETDPGLISASPQTCIR